VPPPPHVQSRSEPEDHHENDQTQETDSDESDMDDTAAPTHESPQAHIPEEIENIPDAKTVTDNVAKTEELDKPTELSHSEDTQEAEASDVDPEVARRIAIRERMAKMSGGMGMHMGMGMAPSPFAKTKPQSKPHSAPLTSPSYERRDPIPVIPGLPPVKSVEPEREAKIHSTAEAEGHQEISEPPPPPQRQPSHPSKPMSQEPEEMQSSDEGEADEVDSDEKEAMDSDGEEEDGADDHVESLQEAEVPDHPASPPPPSRKATESIHSIPEQGLRSPVARQTSFHGPSSSIPSIPPTLPPSLDQSPRSSRPPPPPPPLSPPSQSGPPPVPVPRKFDSLHELSMQSRDVANDEDYEDDSSVISEEDQYAGTSSHDFSRDFSPSSPMSKPPPPPLPPSSPPGSPAMFSPKAVSPPPIPVASRRHDARPSHTAQVPLPPSIPAPPVPPAEKYNSTDLDVTESHPPYPTSAPPEPASFRRTYSERHSLESPQGRSSVDHFRRDGGYLAMKEENIQDKPLWWLEKAAPPTVFQNRTDIVFEVEDSTSTRRGGRTTITREVYVLFSDYSQTVITVTYDRDEPSQASFNQRHLPPPDQPSKGELESRHEQVGSQIVSLAQSKLGAIVGDGTPLAFVSDIFSRLDNCLPSVGARAHGATIYDNLGNSSTRQFDEIRPGDIVVFRSAVFQAHSGLRGKVTTEVGKPDHVAVVQEWNGVKKKLKVLEQRRDNRKVSPNSYKMGDLRSGELHVFRPMPRSWVDW
jgi:myosin tail region-interacting protein MTI1